MDRKEEIGGVEKLKEKRECVKKRGERESVENE